MSVPGQTASANAADGSAPVPTSRPTLPTPPVPRQVYLFATCVIDLMAPQAGVDAITLIRHAGIEVAFPPAQSCCGQPAYTSGYTDEARQVARAQLDLFPQPWPIVVPSGSCAGMMVHHWPKLFAGDPVLSAKAQAVAARVVEWTHFARDVLGLADRLGLPVAAPPPPMTHPATSATAAGQGHPRIHPLTQPVKVALHTSCSARREMGCHLPSEALLRALPGVSLVEQARVAECCGFGGTFSARHPAISGAMVNDKLDAIRDTGAEVLVSADCGCLLNLHHAAERRRASGDTLPRVVHLASFIRERHGATDAAKQVTD